MTFLAGFGVSFGLILAIGSQNAFVLRQGIRRAHVFWVCLCCALSDMLLIIAGVSGFDTIVSMAHWVEPLARYGGALFLFSYALLSFKRAWQGESSLCESQLEPQSLQKALLTCLALLF